MARQGPDSWGQGRQGKHQHAKAGPGTAGEGTKEKTHMLRQFLRAPVRTPEAIPYSTNKNPLMQALFASEG